MKIKKFEYRSAIVLSEGRISDIEVLRTGVIQDRGLKISRKMLEDYIANFKANVYGTELQVNLEHNRGSEAAGWIKELYITDHQDTGVASLMAKVEWTEMGQEKISKNLFKFVSAELAYDYPHHETGKPVKHVFIGLALTNTPALKGQQPVTLNEAAEKLLLENFMLKVFLAELKKRAVVSKADKELVKTLIAELEDGAEKTEAEAEQKEIDKKPETVEKTPEELAKEKKDKEDADAAAKKAAEGKEGEEQLTEKLTASNKEIAELKERIEKKDLAEEVGTLLLSEKKADEHGVKTGLTGKDVKEKVVAFMLGLTHEQRETFKTLINAVRTVTVSALGEATLNEEGIQVEELDDKITKYAAKLVAKAKEDGKELSIEDAQKMATKHFKDQEDKE